MIWLLCACISVVLGVDGIKLSLNELSLVFISGVCVTIDLATELSSLRQTLATNLVSFIIGKVQLEEASMRLRECVSIHMRLQPELVLVFELGAVNRQATSTPDKLQVQGFLFFCECFEHSPEPSDEGMISLH